MLITPLELYLYVLISLATGFLFGYGTALIYLRKIINVYYSNKFAKCPNPNCDLCVHPTEAPCLKLTIVDN